MLILSIDKQVFSLVFELANLLYILLEHALMSLISVLIRVYTYTRILDNRVFYQPYVTVSIHTIYRYKFTNR